jgi:hypothetical protein
VNAAALRNATEDTYIVRASATDAEALTRVILGAFFDIAPCAWLFPAPEVRRERLPAMLREDVEHALAHGIVYTTVDRAAAALWYIHPGGPIQNDHAHVARIVEAVGPDHAERVRVFEACTRAVRPTEPHDYLFIAAVDTGKQRHGLGARLLAGCHRDLAQAGRPAYLEASDEGTRRFYLGLEYEDAVGRRIELPGQSNTTLHPMHRPWIPAPQQRVSVRNDVPDWGGANGRVTYLRAPTAQRRVRVAIAGDETRDFALSEIRPHQPSDPNPL